MAALVYVGLYFCTVGGSGDASSIFINVRYQRACSVTAGGQSPPLACSSGATGLGLGLIADTSNRI